MFCHLMFSTGTETKKHLKKEKKKALTHPFKHWINIYEGILFNLLDKVLPAACDRKKWHMYLLSRSFQSKKYFNTEGKRTWHSCPHPFGSLYQLPVILLQVHFHPQTQHLQLLVGRLSKDYRSCFAYLCPQRAASTSSREFMPPSCLQPLADH